MTDLAKALRELHLCASEALAYGGISGPRYAALNSAIGGAHAALAEHDAQPAQEPDLTHCGCGDQFTPENLAAAEKVAAMLGVDVHRGRARARIHVSGKSVHIGYFDSAAAAHGAYLEAKRLLHPGCTI